MLRFDPGKRVTALEALKDPYLAAYTTGDEAAQCGSAAAISRDTKWLAGTGAFNVSKLELQNMVFQEMIDFHLAVGFDHFLLYWDESEEVFDGLDVSGGATIGTGVREIRTGAECLML